MRDASLCDSAAAAKGPQASSASATPASPQASTADRMLASPQMHIRLASADDADGIRAVYAPFVDTPVTFEEEVPSCETYRERIERICEKYPCLVAEEGGRIVGFAYAHELRERIAFQWNAELSIYLAPAAQGRGAGSCLYAALLELLRLMGIKAVYGVVTSPMLQASDCTTRSGSRSWECSRTRVSPAARGTMSPGTYAKSPLSKTRPRRLFPSPCSQAHTPTR